MEGIEMRTIRESIAGDIVRWTTPVKSGLWRVVQNWTKDEPRSLLVTAVDEENEKCYVALACDCEFIQEGNVVPKTYGHPKVKVHPLPNHMEPRDGEI